MDSIVRITSVTASGVLRKLFFLKFLHARSLLDRWLPMALKFFSESKFTSTPDIWFLPSRALHGPTESMIHSCGSMKILIHHEKSKGNYSICFFRMYPQCFFPWIRHGWFAHIVWFSDADDFLSLEKNLDIGSRKDLSDFFRESLKILVGVSGHFSLFVFPKKINS